jgi:two-component system CheB/CheR fusion protein
VQGRGLNSIRWRFALASAVLVLVGVPLREQLGGPGLQGWASLLLLALGVSACTFWMASKLTGSIRALQRSTEALANGDFDAPVEVDCNCEVGGLATSFRKMATRLNSNLLRINTLAYTDAITALPNRSVIDHLLRYALAPERVQDFRAAILFIDLDGFKRINDTLGHEGGDELLRQASRRILEQGLGRTLQTIDSCTDDFGNPCSRLPVDTVFARFAGDEFVAVLPGQTDRTQLLQVGEAIIAALADPFRIHGQQVSVSASIGIAITPDDAVTATELLSFADLAMYTSKQAGKARCCFFDKQIRAGLMQRTETEADLRLALKRGELLLHYQSKLDAARMTLCGVEALVRWQHPQRGLLMPAAFIDLAEQTGLMAQLGEQVLRLAVAQCRAWLDAGVRRTVAVNVSPSQFSDPAFVERLLALLHQAQLPPSMLSIEITESMAMTNGEATVQRLDALRAAGVVVAIDDFGTGYSNLSHLSQLPLDVLKIDQSLIQGIGDNAKSEAIVRAILGMARALGHRVVAEGIETWPQLQFLQALGCDAVQGYLLGRPMPAAQLDSWRAPVAAEAAEEWAEQRAEVPAG